VIGGVENTLARRGVENTVFLGADHPNGNLERKNFSKVSSTGTFLNSL